MRRCLFRNTNGNSSLWRQFIVAYYCQNNYLLHACLWHGSSIMHSCLLCVKQTSMWIASRSAADTMKHTSVTVFCQLTLMKLLAVILASIGQCTLSNLYFADLTANLSSSMIDWLIDWNEYWKWARTKPASIVSVTVDRSNGVTSGCCVECHKWI